MRISGLAVVFMLALAAALSFAGSTQAAPQSGSVTISPTSFNFGSVTVGGGENSTQFLLTNGTASDITITGVAITPSSESYTATTDCQSDLQSLQRCDVYVNFRPVNVGVKNYSLTVSTSAGTLTLPLTGIGAPSPMVFSPTSLAFGNAVVGVSSTKTSTLTNTSSTGVYVSSINVINTSSYAVTNNCVPFLDAGASCTVTVAYDPISPGAKNFSIVATDGYGEQTLSVTGTGTASPISVTPSSIAFGTGYVGQASVQSVVVKNVSNASVTFTSIATTAGKESYTSTNNCPNTLQGGASCTVRVTFDPVSEGAKNYQLLVADNVGTQVVPLTGTGAASPMTLSPSQLMFGTEPIGYKSSAQVTLANSSGATVAISGIGIAPVDARSYTQTNNCPKSLVAGTSCVITVVFDPVNIGLKNFSLYVVDSVGTQALPLVGTGAQASLPNLAYANPVSFDSGGMDPESVVVADFNGDKKPDIAVSNEISNTITVFLNKGDGTFGEPIVTTPSIAAANVGRIVVADFNKDGKQDLLLGTIAGAQSDYVLLGNGDGTFTQLAAVPNSFGFEAAAVGDFNGDGNLDYVVPAGEVHFGKGDGTFPTSVALPPILNFYNPYLGVTAGDFNNDKKLDVAAVAPSNSGLGHVVVWLGNGDGTFQDPLIQTVDGTVVTSVQSADFNNDGIVDLLFTYDFGADIGLGVGNGRFGVGDGGYGYAYPVYYSPQTIQGNGTIARIADFDHDGLPDVVSGDYDLGNLTVTLNAGIGYFPSFPLNTSITIPLAPVITDIATDDLNGDGTLDIVTINSQTNQVTVFLSKKPQ